ncbi:MAG: glutathione S-transferase family protein [Hyphomicrobiales bacterium]
MLELYHNGASVCSAKVRIGLAEKGLDWKSHHIDLPSGEQFSPEYLKINRNAVVPTLIHDGHVIAESSIILEYIDEISSNTPLMPSKRHLQYETKLWLHRCLDIHGAINTMTFSTVNRDKVLASKTSEQIAASIAQMPSPKAAQKRADLFENGLDSIYVTNDFEVLRILFDDMHEALQKSKWMLGDDYSLADTALLSYIDRLDRLGMSGMWEDRTPTVGKWLAASRARASYAAAIDKFIPDEAAISMREAGDATWPKVKTRWDAFLNSRAK